MAEDMLNVTIYLTPASIPIGLDALKA